MFVFVLNDDKKPLNPTHPARARKLLKAGKAAVFKRYPFTIVLKDEVKERNNQPLRIKIDPGAKTTGIAILRNDVVLWAAELTHRGFQIREALTSRRQLRRSRRNRKTRYRQPRFNNRKRNDGWLPPSLISRVDNILTWVKRLLRLSPITAISTELVRFDTQLMQNPEISGIEYQQGVLAGYELREYMLEKWHRKCAYCGVTDTRLEIDHIIPRSKSGSNRVSNLTLSCTKCNQKKGNKPIEQFLKKKPDLLKSILAQAKKPLADTAAVNATRWKLFNSLKELGLPVETGTGGRTKYNRCRSGLPKTHWLDASNVGASTPENLKILVSKPLIIKATGHGNRQMCGSNAFGFPIRHRSNIKKHFGFQTGDILQAVVTKGKKIGSYVGRVLCRATGSFDIITPTGRVAGISHKYCSFIHRSDGYGYQCGN
ncbi:RNA-guided endonuclease IscB [Coleofasciculus sp.]|uniref:RNA-guided endonuclease IscB n=1 Tax=Coleofasciculus sp. TaxID=3100458 RepID=UPI0039FA4478